MKAIPKYDEMKRKARSRTQEEQLKASSAAGGSSGPSARKRARVDETDDVIKGVIGNWTKRNKSREEVNFVFDHRQGRQSGR